MSEEEVGIQGYASRRRQSIACAMSGLILFVGRLVHLLADVTDISILQNRCEVLS